jgi:prepilin-type N-terminal cleavage/methylation domain-containing protein
MAGRGFIRENPCSLSVQIRSSAFTLIEIIMAMAILAVGIIGVVRLLPVGLRTSKSAEMLTKAAFLGQKKTEELKLAGFEALSGQSIALQGEQGQYSWLAQVSAVSLAGLASSEDIRRLSLTVSWQERGSPRSQEFLTYIGK